MISLEVCPILYRILNQFPSPFQQKLSAFLSPWTTLQDLTFKRLFRLLFIDGKKQRFCKFQRPKRCRDPTELMT